MTSLLKAEAVGVEGRFGPADLVVRRPELIGVVGPNGGGKTSLLRALAGVEDAQGTVRIDGEELASASPARRARLVSFLPASREVVWPIRARDVIELGPTQPNSGRVEQMIERLELQALVDRQISHLSTGERSRVLIARAFAAAPRLLLLDEPLANLDPYWVIAMLQLAREAVDTQGSAAILSLHDLAQADAFDRLILIDNGRVAADSKPASVIDSAVFGESFRIARSGAGWALRQLEDRRSSP